MDSQALQLIVQAIDVIKTYSGPDAGSGDERVLALRGISFQVQRGEIVAIMGPSGCGKTTLLNCLAGLETIDSGTIAIDGRQLAHMHDRERTRLRARSMGFIFQNFNLLPVLSAVENVELPLLIAGEDPGRARRSAREQLAAVGLVNRERHRPAELSGGQRQRVAIARALINDPPIIWADEPTGNLDSDAAAEVMRLLADLNQARQQTLVLVTHAREIAAYAGRTVQMRDGRVVEPDNTARS